MGRKRDPEKCKEFLICYNSGMSQKEAAGKVGWSETAASRYLAKVRKENPEFITRKEDIPKKKELEADKRESSASERTTPDTIYENSKKSTSGITIPVTVYTESQKQSIRIAPVEPETKEEKKMMNLNITGYVDYLRTMAGYHQTSVTHYIRELIATDMEMNKDKYEKLKNI